MVLAGDGPISKREFRLMLLGLLVVAPLVGLLIGWIIKNLIV